MSQFGGAQEQTPKRDCLHMEAMLADVLDDALSPAEQAQFDEHLRTCPACTAMLADARRGAAWLDMLHSHQPEPPSDMVARILANTSVRAAAEAAAAEQANHLAFSNASLLGTPMPVAVDAATPAPGSVPFSSARVLPFRVRVTGRLGPTLGAMLQTRMAMTAAMAFFSVALTFNLLGVHVTALRARDLTPSSLRRSASEANARVVRYYESLRVVYELESRVHDLQHSNDSDLEPRRTLQSPTDQPEETQPGSSTPLGGAAIPGTPASKPAPQTPSHEPRSSSTSGTHGGRQTNADAHHLPQTTVPLGPTLPVILHGHAPTFQKGGLA